MYEKWRDNNDPNILKDIETYNEQDCRSMPIMRKWLEETVFENRIQHRLPRDFISTNANNEPEDVFDNEDEAFANAISTYHKREQKPYWWKVFDAQLRDLNELLPDASVFAGLNFKDIKGNVYEYEFEDQEHKFASGQTVRIVAGESNGQNGNQAKIISLDENKINF